MSIHFIIFASSLVLIVGMIVARLLYRKLHDEHFFHRLLTHRARRANLGLKAKIRQGRKILTYFNKKTGILLLHLIIEEVEEYFHRAMNFVRNKFPRHK